MGEQSDSSNVNSDSEEDDEDEEEVGMHVAYDEEQEEQFQMPTGDTVSNKFCLLRSRFFFAQIARHQPNNQ